MENLILSINVVLPLFLLMTVGYISKHLKLYTMDAHEVMNKLVFRLFLPALLFHNIYNTNLDAQINGKVFIFAIAAILLLFGLLFVIIPLIEKDGRRRGVLIQGIGRSNFVLFGMPMAALLCDGDMAVTSLLVAVVVPLFNVCSVISLEVFRGGRIEIKQILLGIAKNPMIVSSLAAFLLMLSGIRFPSAVDKVISDLASIATPFALFLLGGSIEFSAVKANGRALCIGVLGKLVINPLLFITAAILLGFRNTELVSLMIVFMAPSAVSSYTMAQQMGADGELAGQQVVFTTVFSILTIFLFVFVTKTLGYI